jgi:hypothetical protein
MHKPKPIVPRACVLVRAQPPAELLGHRGENREERVRKVLPKVTVAFQE